MSHELGDDWVPRDEDAPPEGLDSFIYDLPDECIYDGSGQGRLFGTNESLVGDDVILPASVLRQQMRADAIEQITRTIRAYASGLASLERIEIQLSKIWDEAYIEGVNARDDYSFCTAEEDNARFQC